MIKKITSLILSLALILGFGIINVSASSLEVSNEIGNEENIDYQIYNTDTGITTYHSFEDIPDILANETEAYSPGYFPNGEQHLFTPFAIIGTDNRSRVNPTNVGPYCNTVYMKATFSNGSTSIFSGFMIGPKAAVTAGHCVYDREDRGQAVSVEVIPAKNGTSNPYGTTTSSNMVVSSKYISGGSTNDDWAVVELKSNLGDSTGWLGLKWQSISYNDTTVYNTGYPSPGNASAQNSSQTYMLVGSGKIRESNTYTLKGDWDATGGNSGGPIYAYYSDTGYTAIAILTAGSADGTSYPTAFTTGTRITKDMYNLFVGYR